ncbi:hypothetical protein LX32DRAFT_644525 [Colletotrichum zoysiae]|uniref:Uncharacterized protein n=1 Tax=Colletotrichum zoysiae TaxID=1216348 RepID=A0AAD9H795_9PEZI|nr:hypothetical protein LX32DRAFT_644525 [Colletotrichum zoysiae]
MPCHADADADAMLMLMPIIVAYEAPPRRPVCNRQNMLHRQGSCVPREGCNSPILVHSVSQRRCTTRTAAGRAHGLLWTWTVKEWGDAKKMRR